VARAASGGAGVTNPSPSPSQPNPVGQPEMLLWRAVSPNIMLNQTRVPDRAWKPTANDGGHLSVTRENAMTAKEAHQQRAAMLAAGANPRPAPIGMLQISVGEVINLPISQGGAFVNPGLTVWDDSNLGKPAGHGYIDHTPIIHDEDAQKAVASALMSRARDHGWAFSLPGAPPRP
jgi:hypothetical protein